jgi:hypothetical protein
MNKSQVTKRALLCLVISFTLASASPAEPMLLAELESHGFCYDCFPTNIRFEFAAFVVPGGGPSVEWSLPVVQSDVGQTFSVPPNLIPTFNSALTNIGEIGARTLFVVNNAIDGGTVYTVGLTYGTQMNVPSVTRLAPILGPNFSGYRITDITQTIDELTIEQLSTNLYREQGAHTVRIYGEPIPEPQSFALMLSAVLLGNQLWVRLSHGQLSPRRSAFVPLEDL